MLLRKIVHGAFAGLIAVAVGGCSAYTAPGGPAALVSDTQRQERHLGTDPTLMPELGRKPLASLPTGVAVARVQDRGYQTRTAAGIDVGAYSLITVRDVEKDEQFERLAKLPMIHGIAPISPLLVERSSATSEMGLRRAAAKLNADMLLVYTFDTRFFSEDKARPLSVITLGLSPNKRVYVNSTVSAVLFDTRSGYVYGTAEASSRESRPTNAWQSDVAVDETRRATESQAFEKLVPELEKMWGGVVTTLRASSPTPPEKLPS